MSTSAIGAFAICHFVSWNMSRLQTVRCLRIVECPQVRPFDPHLGEELHLKSRIAAKCWSKLDISYRRDARPSAQCLETHSAEARLKAGSAKWMSSSN